MPALIRVPVPIGETNERQIPANASMSSAVYEEM